MPSTDDPLSRAMRPPKNETSEQRAERIREEEEATKRSQLIDQQIRAERSQLQKDSAHTHKVLLLDFQLVFTPKSFEGQQKSWKALIQLNLVRSILVICEALTDDPSENDLDIDNFLSLDPSVSPNYSVKQADELLELSTDDKRNSSPYPGSSEAEHGPLPNLTKDHQRLKMRLLPLQHVQAVLVEHLACQFDDPSLLAAAHQFKFGAQGLPDFVIRSNASVQGFMGKNLKRRSSQEGEGGEVPMRLAIQEIDAVLNACRDDMVALWTDPVVREILHRRDVRLEEGPGFFLHEVQRLTELNYVPTQEDVLRARIRTVGVQEYIFKLETGPDVGREWRIYDVGGARNQRHSWPFFDDCHLIFLAPISCFDQVLAEERRINRVEDSLQLWKAVCTSKLLQKSEKVLFLNKCDILQAKLRSGIQFKDWVPKYDGPNDLDGVTKFFKSKFRAIHKTHSPVTRSFYCHLTAVTDAQSTRKILSSVQELVTRSRLHDVSLL